MNNNNIIAMKRNEITLFKCKRTNCKNNCCETFRGFSDRLFSVDKRLFTEIILLPKDVERISKTEYADIMYFENGLFHIKTDDNGACQANKDGICLIYDVKPAICQGFPLYLDAFVGLCANKECPEISDKEEIYYDREMINAILDVYDFWISYYKEKCNKE